MSKKRNKSKTGGGGGKAAGKRGLRGRRIAAAACAVVAVVAVGVALAAFQPWGAGGDGGSDDALPEGVTEIDVKDPEDYVGPDGEGALDRDDYETDEDYIDALADSMAPELEVPCEYVEEDGREYLKGILVVKFDSAIGEGAARAIVEEHGGLWVSSTFELTARYGRAEASAYFPEYADAGLAGMNELRGRIADEEGVASVRLDARNESVSN